MRRPTASALLVDGRALRGCGAGEPCKSEEVSEAPMRHGGKEVCAVDSGVCSSATIETRIARGWLLPGLVGLACECFSVGDLPMLLPLVAEVIYIFI